MCVSEKNTREKIQGHIYNDFMSNGPTYILCLYFLFSFMVPKRFQTLRLHTDGISLFLSLMPGDATSHITTVSVNQAESEAQTGLQAQCQR